MADDRLKIEDIKRGQVVEWDWPASMAVWASERNVRALGLIVSRNDLAHMSVREGPLNIQTIDDPDWLIFPDTVLAKGGQIRLTDLSSVPLEPNSANRSI